MPPATAPWPIDSVLMDLDGTLVDSNYQHALSWFRAFREHGVTLGVWVVHRHIGMGGDQLVPALAGDTFEHAHGESVRDAWKRHFDGLIGDVAVVQGAVELLRDVKSRGLPLVLATSGKPDHVEHYLDLLGARELADSWTTADDVSTTKPAPDLLQVAMDRVASTRPLTVGDATWDCRAAARLGVPSIAVRTGGFSVDELRDAGAGEVFDSLDELSGALDRLVTVIR